MPAGPSTRAVSIAIGYVVLIVALIVIHVGRQQLRRAVPPAETTPVASQPSAPGIDTRRSVEKPAIGAPQPQPPAPVATTPKSPESTRAAGTRTPVARSARNRPETSAPVAPALPPAAPDTAATSGDVRPVPDANRAEMAVPAPAVPEMPVVPGRVGELAEPLAALPRPAALPDVREISPRDRIYEKESSALAQVLGHYEQAYDRLDANRAAAIWPSVDARALSRAFARLQRQDIDFGNCTFSVSVSDAAARCAGVLRYARRIGDTALKTEQHVWTIEFARAGDSWQIVKISAQ